MDKLNRLRDIKINNHWPDTKTLIGIYMNDLSFRLSLFMERQAPSVGNFILQKQCADLGIDYNEIPEDKIKILAEKLAKAMEMFLGDENSKNLKRQILEGKF